MKKFIIILSSLIVVLGAVLCGAYFYNTHLSDECELEAFSFKVPSSFKAEDAGPEGCCFKCFGEELSIWSYHQNITLEAERNSIKDEDIIKFEDLEDTPYDGFVSTLKLYSDEKKVEIFGIFGTDTNYLVASCDCSPLKAKLIVPVIKKIAKSANYTLDFRLADKPDTFDCEYLNVYTGPKYFYSATIGSKKYCSTKTDSQLNKPELQNLDKSDKVLSFAEGYAAADNYSKAHYPRLHITILDDGSSPAELADKEVNELQEKKLSSAMLTRDQQELLGFNCEHIYYDPNQDLTDGIVCNDHYYFSKGEYTYHIETQYHKNADENDMADIKEMLDGITIKETVQK